MAMRMRQLVSPRDGSARHRAGARMVGFRMRSTGSTTRTPQFAHTEPRDPKTLCETSRVRAESVLRGNGPAAGRDAHSGGTQHVVADHPSATDLLENRSRRLVRPFVDRDDFVEGRVEHLSGG